MAKVPEFTERAAVEIERLWHTFATGLSRDDYIACVGWEIGTEDKPLARPAIGLHERSAVPADDMIECHGITLAYNLPARVMEAVRFSSLDFDGMQFVFVDAREVKRFQAGRRRHPNADEKHGLALGAVRTFMRQYGRQAQRGVEPNDRRYDAKIAKRVKRMNPVELDRILRDDED
jgi:hypothetical protein